MKLIIRNENNAQPTYANRTGQLNNKPKNYSFIFPRGNFRNLSNFLSWANHISKNTN